MVACTETVEEAEKELIACLMEAADDISRDLKAPRFRQEEYRRESGAPEDNDRCAMVSMARSIWNCLSDGPAVLPTEQPQSKQQGDGGGTGRAAGAREGDGAGTAGEARKTVEAEEDEIDIFDASDSDEPEDVVTAGLSTGKLSGRIGDLSLIETRDAYARLLSEIRRGICLLFEQCPLGCQCSCHRLMDKLPPACKIVADSGAVERRKQHGKN